MKAAITSLISLSLSSLALSAPVGGQSRGNPSAPAPSPQGAVEGHAAPTAMPVLFDTDIAGDVDDVGALSLLHALADNGEAKILAVGVSSKNRYAARAVDAINEYYGRGNIPIGTYKGSFNSPNSGHVNSRYTKAVATQHFNDIAGTTAAWRVYREVLSQQPDKSVTLVTVGFWTNIQDLLKSRPDIYSIKNGRSLVRDKVVRWIAMGTEFTTGCEYNVAHGGVGPISLDALERWPKEVPITFSDFNVGFTVQTGGDYDLFLPNSPMATAYLAYNGGINRASWDQTAVLFAARPETFGLRRAGILSLSSSGCNAWSFAHESAEHESVFKIGSDETYEELLDNLMYQVPLLNPNP